MGLKKTQHLLSVFFFCALLLAKCTQVYEFSEAGDYEVSTVTIEIKVPRLESFTICSSHKQNQLNYNNQKVFTIFKDREAVDPYLSVGFVGQTLFAEIGLGSSYNVYDAQNKYFFLDWIHICLEIR